MDPQPLKPPEPLKRLILCADDFAVHEAASQGIARLAAAGRISATSAMVLSPRWAADVPLLHDLRDRIDVGLHLDWTSDFAVAAGYGLSLGRAMLRATLGGFNQDAAREVIERQLDAFEAQWKAPPDHVDGHQHVQQFAGIREALVAALAKRYPHRKPYLRVSRAPAGQADFKSRIIASLGASAIELLANNVTGTLATGVFNISGVYDFSGSVPDYGRRMTHWLQTSPDHTIIMCHPALAAEPGDSIGAARAREFAYLSGDDFPVTLTQAHARLARGSDW
jgi:chitin disaccharide deacetylase